MTYASMPPRNEEPTAEPSSDLYFDEETAYYTGLGLRAPHAPFYAQLNSIPQGQQHRSSTQHQLYGVQSSPNRLDVSSLSVALPDNGRMATFRDFNQLEHVGGGHRSHQSPTTPSFQPPQIGDPQMMHYMQQSYPHGNMMMQPPYIAQHPRSGSSPSVYGAFPSFVPQMPTQGYSVPGMQAPFIASYGRSNALPHGQFPQHSATAHSAYILGQTGPINHVSVPRDSGLSQKSPPYEATPSYPRGPPRKPKQSGHALWVGNLPPGTTVTELKDHFSREATKDIESLFLISKSNCAFVNYRTEATCAAAMSRFHDSRFNGVRLVCRLRRGSGSPNEPDTNTGPGPVVKGVQLPDSIPTIGSEVVIASSSSQDAVESPNEAHDPRPDTAPLVVPEKYFVVKSLTLQDLEASVHNGIWATQSHNEAILNKAFEAAENVYLVFSANKSGEYFGYARMVSPISGEMVPMKPAPQVEASESSNAPTSVPTPATEWAPKGRIVDDSARGTIFWEAEAVEVDGKADVIDEIQEEGPKPGDGEKQTSQKHGQEWGKPFQIEWISTNRLPFYRTRGLRNPWNANREVKIARDGTELEPSVGRRLVQMFHRPAAPLGMPVGGPMVQGMMPHY